MLSMGSYTDRDGNTITSQVNGTQQALDVGVAVNGSQVDPREIRPLTSVDTVTVEPGTGTFPVSATVLPLPTGAATETTLASVDSKIVTTANGIKVDGSAVVQPVSGTVTANIQPTTGSFVDRSGTLNTVASTIMPANPSRKYLFIQNLSTKRIYINFTGTASMSSGSIRLDAGGSFTLMGNICSGQAVSAVADANGVVYTAVEL